jgi:D-sedoheptulose 7-phosphate isomerase
MKYVSYLKGEYAEHMAMFNALETLFPQLSEVGILLQNCIKNGGKILICGNGGSAADSQHIAAEIVGRFKKERKGLPAIALTTDTSILTSVGNDYGYDYIFARQVEALCTPKDVLIGITTSAIAPM